MCDLESTLPSEVTFLVEEWASFGCAAIWQGSGGVRDTVSGEELILASFSLSYLRLI